MYKFIITHFQKYRQLKPWLFCLLITIEGFIVSWVIVMLIHQFFHFQIRRDLISLSPLMLILYSVMLGPWIETLLFQSFPVFFMRLLKAKFHQQLLVSILIFALPHFWSSIGTGIGAGIVGGFYYSFTYVHWIEKSFWVALWSTAVSHMLHNALTLLLMWCRAGFPRLM